MIPMFDIQTKPNQTKPNQCPIVSNVINVIVTQELTSTNQMMI